MFGRFAAAAVLSCIAAGTSGCLAHEVNKHNAGRYENAAAAAQANGDWVAATEHWRRAYINARSGRAPEGVQAAYLYEYGRSAGAICRFADAEQALVEAVRLDALSGGPVYMGKVELGRLNLDQGKVAEARRYFDEAVPLLEQAGAEAESPIAFADILDEHANTLRQAGERSKAAAATRRAQRIRAANPKGHSITDRTPYGKHCPKES